MSTTITHAGGTITPAGMPEWEAEAEARTIVHTILGRADPDITTRSSGLRRGSLTLVFASAAEAGTARATLLTPQAFSINNADVPQIAMTFVVAGGEVRDARGSAGEWTLTVPFQEISS